MSLCLDFLGQENAFHDTFFIEEESRAVGAHILSSVHALFAPHTHGFHQLLVRVGNEGERKFVLLDELLM